jgi:hypothetical protein
LTPTPPLRTYWPPELTVVVLAAPPDETIITSSSLRV